MEDTLRIKLQVEGEEFHQSMKDAKEEVRDVGKSTDRLSDALGKVSPALGRVAANLRTAFSGMKEGMANVRTSMASLKTGATGMQGMASAAGSLVSALLPALTVIAAVVGAVMLLKKAWEFLKKAFKAWDPTGYAKTFGTLRLELRKLMTAVGALTSGAVQEIVYAVTGIVRGLRQMVEVLVRIKSWVDGILGSLGEAGEIISWMVAALGGGFGVAFKVASEQGKKAAEEVGEVWSEEMSVGLAAFDKLNNIGMETEGDSIERQELLEDLEATSNKSESIFDKIKNGFAGLATGIGDFFGGIANGLGNLWAGFSDWIGGVADGIGELWAGFADWAGNAWATVSKTAGEVWKVVSTTVSALWNNFTSWAGNAWATVSNVAGRVWGVVSSRMGDLWSDFRTMAGNAVGKFKDMFLEALSWIKKQINGLIGGLQSSLDRITGAIGGAVTDSVMNVADGLGSDLTTVASGAVKVSKGDLGGIGDMVGGVVNAAGRRLGEIADGIGNAIGSIGKRFGFAQGGVFEPNHPQLAVLGDNTAEPEVAAPYSMIVSAVTTALNNMGVGSSGGSSPTGGAPIDITLEIDGKRLARMTYDNYENERIRRNGSGSY